MFLELKDAIIYLVSRLAISLRWTSWAHQANRKFVEALLHEISEKDWTLKLTLSEELASKSAATQKDSASHDFKDEPLIRDAIELFNARVTPKKGF